MAPADSERMEGAGMTKAIVGVIGGSGVYHLPGLIRPREETVSTPWGEPSDALRFGRIGDTEAVFLARHGRGHRFSPSTINYRANIDALKRAGVTDIIALSACGSFHRELYPGVFVLIDQFVDRTYLRVLDLLRNRLRRPCLDGASDRPAPAPAPGRGDRGGGGAVQGRRHVPLHGGPAILVLRRVARPPGARRRRHRHDRGDRGQARPRSGDLLRDGGHGDRLRLLVRGARSRRRRHGHQSHVRQRRQGGAGRRPHAAGLSRRARALPDRAPTARSNTPSSPIRRRAIRRWSQSSTRSPAACSAAAEAACAAPPPPT